MRLKIALYFFISPLLLLVFSCGPSRTVTFNITQPAQITFPSEANKILLIDRTKFSSEMQNTIEGILTGELPADDKVAAQEALLACEKEITTLQWVIIVCTVAQCWY